MNGFARRMSAALAVAALAMLAGCRSHTAPSDVLTGTWRGTIQDDVRGAGTIEMTMTWKVLSAAGRWSATFDAGGTAAGSLNAIMNGGGVIVYMTTEDPPSSCGSLDSLAMTATLDGTTLAGPYVILACDGATGGNISVVRVP